jgi:hypothetical protein
MTMSTVEHFKMDFFELGDKTSLICADPTTSEPIRNGLHELGFKFHTADTGDAAVERLRYTQYDCIVVHEAFAGNSLRSNPVLRYLAPLPMAQRRNSFVCIVGPSLKTLDAMQAFVHSVHVVVNPADIANLAAILKKSLAEFELQYKVYREALAASGEK